MKPKFTIAIPAYNHPEYLRQAIRSCVEQTFSDFEVIISDDCSGEDLASVVKSFDDSRVKYLRNRERLGATKNFQHSVSLSQTEYVVNLNADDLLLPDYLEAAGAALDQNIQAVAVYSAAVQLSGSTVFGWQTMPKLSFAGRQQYLENPWLEKFHNIGPTCCLFRKAAFDSIGGYRVCLRFAADWDLYMRLMTIAGGVLFLPKILSIARRHEGQMTRVSNFDGLKDVLELWQLREYSHWPEWEISELALTQVSAGLRGGGDWFDVLQLIRNCGLTSRLLKGLPRAVFEKTRARIAPRNRMDRNYQSPVNVESAVRMATAMISR